MAVTLILLLLLFLPSGQAQTAGQEYRLPPKAMVDLVDAPPTPSVSLSPDRRVLLVMEEKSLPSIAELAEPELRLAGLRINSKTNGPSRVTHFFQLTLLEIASGKETPVRGLPPEPRIGAVRWSADSRYLAFPVTRENEIQLWVAEAASGQARQLSGVRLNDAYGQPFFWISGTHDLICRTVPRTRGAPPKAPEAPVGPVIQQNLGQEAPARTYQDLLENPHDEALFEHYLTSQVVRFSLDGKITPLGRPDMITRAEPSPDGAYLLTETIRRPFSYLVPVYRFGRRVEIWNRGGKLVRQLSDQPPAEEVPIAFDAVPTGPRSFDWRPDADAAVYWAEARDGGDPRTETEVRDELLILSAPFQGKPETLMTLGLRYAAARWAGEGFALVREAWWKTRREKTWLARLGPDAPAPDILFDRSFEDRYTDPGSPLTRPSQRGQPVLITANDGETLFFAGEGASPEGSRPFLDAFDLGTKAATRLFRSQDPYYESVAALLDEEGKQILTHRESQNEPPNYFARNLDSDGPRPVTKFPHPYPQMAGVHKELIRYNRADGVALTATLYLPPGYSTSDGPLPTLMWAYPREFKSADAAGQITVSPHRFVRISPHSPLFWLTEGYAILDGPTMPVIGEGKREPNDTYIDQLVAGAKAAIDEAARRGVTDPGRVAIGGHSYGAFMTANLLAHSDLFRAGIAQSGAYNRTLTPFGFQAEERTFWQAPEIYFRMSPFMHAHKVNEPILLTHGIADNNAGTFPIQSERFYHALKGHGATARLVLLPHESHGYRARESVLHLLWEKTEWLKKYVKQAKARKMTGSPSSASR